MRVSVRVSEGVMNQIVHSGEFKTQFETGKSGGMLNTATRAKAEMSLYGLDPFDTPVSER